MIDPGAVAEIIATYQKHGWILRRVLLSDASKAALEPLLSDISRSVPVLDRAIDAAWFSRPPKGVGVAWEIRYLGDTPFALLENMDENSPDFEENLRIVEARLNDAVSSKKSA